MEVLFFILGGLSGLGGLVAIHDASNQRESQMGLAFMIGGFVWVSTGALIATIKSHPARSEASPAAQSVPSAPTTTKSDPS